MFRDVRKLRDVSENFPDTSLSTDFLDTIPERLEMTPNGQTSIGVWNYWSSYHSYRIESVGYTTEDDCKKWEENK